MIKLWQLGTFVLCDRWGELKQAIFILTIFVNFLETVNVYMHIVFSYAVVSSFRSICGFSVECLKLLVGMMALITQAWYHWLTCYTAKRKLLKSIDLSSKWTCMPLSVTSLYRYSKYSILLLEVLLFHCSNIYITKNTNFSKIIFRYLLCNYISSTDH